MSEDARVNCCYCGRELHLQGQVPHQSRCLFGPNGDAVKEFMRRHASDGVAMMSKHYKYNKERMAAGLPDVDFIYSYFRTWPRFVEWCGLLYVRRHGKMTTAEREAHEQQLFRRLDREFADARKAIESAYDFRAIKGVRQYIELYRDMDTGEVHERYVTVLL